MRYFIVDAFADDLFKGNPAGVCVLEEWLSDDILQNIAAENNLSETAFIVKEGKNYHIRWFTPKYEIDLCGHATLGSSFVIANFLEPGIKQIRFKSMSGELKVKCSEDLYTLDFPVRNIYPVLPNAEIEEILHVKPEEIYLSRDMFIVVDSEETVRNLQPDFDKMSKFEAGDGVIVTAKGEECDFVSRCFYPKCGINEDPVTGSAHCNLIPYWAKKLGKTILSARQLSERGGNLQCELHKDRVKISGKAVLYLEGVLHF